MDCFNNTISVIVPIYNMAKYLPSCINSILSQSYTQLEIILVNDGSTDASGDICDVYARKDSRIRVIHQENQGVAAARNSGLAAVSGSYIGFVDPDDEILPEMYSRLLQVLVESQAEWSQCGVWVDKAGSGGGAEGWKSYSGLDFLRLGMEVGVPKTLWCNLYAAHLWKNLQFEHGYCYEDEMVFPQLAAQCARVVVLPEKLYVYRRLETGIVRTPKTMMHLRSKEKLFSVLAELYDKISVKKSLAAFYLCKMIPSYRMMIEGNEYISSHISRAHNKRMHAMFCKCITDARGSHCYAQMPILKRVYWNLYLRLPRIAYQLVKIAKSIAS